jgi:hypothetical protein
MAVLIATLAGALLGWLFAARRGAARLDRWHHAGVGAVIFCALSILAVVVFSRMG